MFRSSYGVFSGLVILRVGRGLKDLLCSFLCGEDEHRLTHMF